MTARSCSFTVTGFCSAGDHERQRKLVLRDNGLSDGNHTYIVRVTDRAGNYTESDGFVLNVDTSIPTTTAAITAQTTSDTTPIVSGTVSADTVNGEYLVVTVNGKTYTSQTGGAVVVDPDHNTVSADPGRRCAERGELQRDRAGEEQRG